MAEEEKKKEQKRVMPQSELDFVMLTTDAVWGKPEVSQELKSRLIKYFRELDDKGKQLFDKEGNPIVTSESLWGLLGFFTRDLRLANLSVWNGELEYCRYYLDLAGDFLQVNLIEPFLICLSRVATATETSQSKGGFLRRRLGTFTSEQLGGEAQEPPKKTLFGGPKKNKKT